VTILVAAAVGYAFARSVSRRVSRVAEAAGRVAGGDLEVRVPEEGRDEIGDLAVSFNRMLGDLERSRARIEYLQRIGAWQEMARRLAHEIKNPLTPIQLAVEECHHKYKGDDPKMRKLLDTTLEIVTEEVGTLRRLVSEFSDFARLPRARLEEASLEALLAEVRPPLERLGMGTELGDAAYLTPSGGPAIPVRVAVEPTIADVPSGAPPLAVAVDRQMLRKALDNLVRNAVQAIRAAGRGFRVVVHATELDDGRVAIDVDDDGPGVPESDRARVFDPYFTTRTEGTGLGLAIVKKIVIEHGGSIACDVAPLGGARFRIVLPAIDSAEARAALERAERS
jgi:two-component system, NtrC family, nitrogen regulation sensor histidine kinase NtrY